MVGRRRGPGPAGRGGRRRLRRRRRRRRVMLVGGLIAIGTKKMTPADAQAIEEHTGIPPEELEDGDLEVAMQELGIADEEVSEDDAVA